MEDDGSEGQYSEPVRVDAELFSIDASAYPKFDPENPPWTAPQALTRDEFLRLWEDLERAWRGR